VLVRSVRLLLITANIVPSSPTLVTLIMEVLRSSETSILTRATLRNIPEDGILQHKLTVSHIRFEVLTAVTMNKPVFLDVLRVVLVRTDVSEQHSTSIMWLKRIGELGTSAVTINRSTLHTD
jgi:hypothetical protein